MKINVAYPANGTQKQFELSTIDEQRLYGKKIGEQFDGKLIGKNFENTVIEITGGCDYQGFPMVKGKDTTKRIRLLLKKGDTGFRGREAGVRKRKTVRGSQVSLETMCLNVILVKENENVKIEGLTDVTVPKTALPKKINKLCALFDCTRDELKSKIKSLPSKNMRKIKIVREVRTIRAIKRGEEMVARREKKAENDKLREEYQAKYGVKL